MYFTLCSQNVLSTLSYTRCYIRVEWIAGHPSMKILYKNSKVEDCEMSFSIVRAGHIEHYQLKKSYGFKPFFATLWFSFLKLKRFVLDYSVTAEVRYALQTVLHIKLLLIIRTDLYSPKILFFFNLQNFIFMYIIFQSVLNLLIKNVTCNTTNK
jgi:hypothetical protein